MILHFPPEIGEKNQITSMVHMMSWQYAALVILFMYNTREKEHVRKESFMYCSLKYNV